MYYKIYYYEGGVVDSYPSDKPLSKEELQDILRGPPEVVESGKPGERVLIAVKGRDEKKLPPNCFFPNYRGNIMECKLGENEEILGFEETEGLDLS